MSRCWSSASWRRWRRHTKSESHRLGRPARLLEEEHQPGRLHQRPGLRGLQHHRGRPLCRLRLPRLLQSWQHQRRQQHQHLLHPEVPRVWQRQRLPDNHNLLHLPGRSHSNESDLDVALEQTLQLRAALSGVKRMPFRPNRA